MTDFVSVTQSVPSSTVILGGAIAVLGYGLFWLIRRQKDNSSDADSAADMVIVDGSNALYWKDNTPDIQTVVMLLNQLRDNGFKTGVIFDASAGHVLFNRYVDDDEFACVLGLNSDQYFVVPKGTIADEYILNAARDLQARVVTNDRYRDWAHKFPEVRTAGFLIGGTFDNGDLLLKSQVAS